MDSLSNLPFLVPAPPDSLLPSDPCTLLPLLGIGIDLMSMERLKASLQLHRFRVRVYAREELEAFQPLKANQSLENPKSLEITKSLELLAKAFALKEATLKALGTGWAQGVELHEVVTHWNPGATVLDSDCWTLVLRGRALEHATQRGVEKVGAQCTHEGGLCLATVWLWGAAAPLG